MKIKLILVILSTTLFSFNTISQNKKHTDANLIGHVVSEGEHIPFATIIVKGTTIGTSTDETGHFQILNMPEGKYTIIARLIGYSPKSTEVTMTAEKTTEIKFDLEKDALNLDEIVITGDRNATSRRNASVIVSSITPRVFEMAQAPTLGDGLNFTPGLRMEYNCQNCGFSQIRMNGMEGPYSQILINGRSIFSGLAGVYGLELMPQNMIEKVEIVRGGGSALYGSNAIAGTINLILKDPITNSYQLDASSGLVGVGINGSGKEALEYTAKFNTSIISNDTKTGMALYGFYRERNPFDANGDDFSDITGLSNTTVGTRIFHRFKNRNRITLDAFRINEDRRGGDKANYIEHEAGIAESIKHKINTAALTYEQFFRNHDKLSVYASGQNVDRKSYYGAEQSLSDYGYTEDFSYNAGAQYHMHLGISELTLGVEEQGAWLTDNKLGYPDLENIEITVNGTDTSYNIPHTNNVEITDQRTNTFSAFSQYDLTYGALKVTAGLRFDNYIVTDNHANTEKTDNVLSPRLTIKYDIIKCLQARISYSQGYRAPQIFDEDLHIETSGARKVLHTNAPDLKQETSHSFMGSFDFNKKLGTIYFGLLAEGFYTKLNDAFANEYSDPDANGVVTYTRINATEGATVVGMNLELNVIPAENLQLQGGFTYQISEYGEEIAFGEKSFMRTPNDYGFFTINYNPIKHVGIAATGTYTGSMKIEYYGNTISNPDEGELRVTDPFLDMGIKAHYNIKLSGVTLQIYAGAKNIFNSYQNDFDSGIDRDPGYVYGPGLPRMIYAGIKIGNLIK